MNKYNTFFTGHIWWSLLYSWSVWLLWVFRLWITWTVVFFCSVNFFLLQAKETALHVCARYDQPEVLSHLCAEGAELNLPDNVSWQPVGGREGEKKIRRQPI